VRKTSFRRSLRPAGRAGRYQTLSRMPNADGRAPAAE
jgi:hypothetical protein